MKRLAVLALASLLSGCSFSLPFSDPAQEVQYYVLGAPSSPAKALTAPRIGVMPVSMPGYLSRPQLVIREADGVNIRVLDFDRWGEELGIGVSRVLCDALAAEGVSAVPLRTGTQVDAKLMLDIRRLDGAPGRNVTLDAVWTVQKGKAVFRSGHVVKSLESGKELADMVEAQSSLIRVLAADIARAIQ